MLELLKEEMHYLSSFCKEKNDVPLWSCIEGNMGRAWVDNKESPSIAIVVVADFCYLLGCITRDKFHLSMDVLFEKCRGIVTLKSGRKIVIKAYSDTITTTNRIRAYAIQEFIFIAFEAYRSEWLDTEHCNYMEERFRSLYKGFIQEYSLTSLEERAISLLYNICRPFRWDKVTITLRKAELGLFTEVNDRMNWMYSELNRNDILELLKTNGYLKISYVILYLNNFCLKFILYNLIWWGYIC